ncbi:MAG TPA: hypothetical protein VFX96_08470 [Pyrinomonadaceae bacterium]|nr:hypothetical protein [Pyrinomonadaceae bacterium]
MGRRKVTTELVVEREEVVVVRAVRRARLWCDACACESEFVGPEAAALRARTTVRTVFLLVEQGRAHFVETPEGLLLVCLRSLGPR